MTLKTPDQIADELIDTFTWPLSERITISATKLADTLVAAIEADRAQRDLADAWREGYQAGYRDGYDCLYGHAENPYN